MGSMTQSWDDIDLDKLYEQMMDSVYGPRSAQGGRGSEVVGTFDAGSVSRGSNDPDVVSEVRRMALEGGGSLKRASGKRGTYTVRITEEAHLKLREIAKEFGLFWGGDGNISGLMQLIGEGKLRVELQE